MTLAKKGCILAALILVGGCVLYDLSLTQGSFILIKLGFQKSQKYYARQTSTIASAKQIAEAVMLYVEDNGGSFPHRFTTNEDLRRVMPEGFNALVFNVANPSGGEFVPNAYLEGRNMSEFDERFPLILFYETEEWDEGERTCALTDTHAWRLDGMPDLGPVTIDRNESEHRWQRKRQ